MDIEKTMENLRRRGFSPKLFETAQDALEYLACSLSGKTIGFGGSVTVADMGLYERLAENNQVYWHWKDKSPDILQKAAGAQVYICSANAVAETGEIVNIDGNGNRMAAVLFDREKVFFLCGVNKLTPTLEDALWRARNVAAPKNAARLGRKTPCIADGKCHDCRSPERSCMAEVVLRGKPMGVGSMELILINQELGY